MLYSANVSVAFPIPVSVSVSSVFSFSISVPAGISSSVSYSLVPQFSTSVSSPIPCSVTSDVGVTIPKITVPYSLGISDSFSVSVLIKTVTIPYQLAISDSFNVANIVKQIKTAFSIPVPESSSSGNILVKLIKAMYNLSTAFGQQFQEGIELEQITDFITDYYSLRYLSRQVGLSKLDIIRTITALSNLLRNCEMYEINEVFLGSIRLQKAKDKNYWVLVER